MSQQYSNQESGVKIHNNRPPVMDIDGVDNIQHVGLERMENAKSKTNIKLNPISAQPNYSSAIGSSGMLQYNQPTHLNPLPSKHYEKFQIQLKDTQRESIQLEKMSPTKLKKEYSDNTIASPTRLSKKIKKGYQLATYGKAIDYLHSQSYRKKVTNVNDGEEQYQTIDVCGSNEQLKQFGLGVYLYFQFLKRLAIVFFIMSAILIFPLVTSYKGSGLSKYTSSSSFTMTLAKFTLGNIANGDQQAYLIITISDILTMLVLFLFYIHWRSFHRSTIQEMEKDHTILNPTSYALSVDNFCDQLTNYKTLELEMKAYIDTVYKGAYQIEIVSNYRGSFGKFIDYDQQIQLAEKESQIIRQTGKDTSKLIKIQQKLAKMEEEIQHISQAFQPLYAIIHFKTLKAKLAFINHCKRYRLQSTTSQSIQRALCCTPLPPEKFLFLRQFPLFIRNNKLSRPEQINWRNVDLSSFSIFLRWILSLILVLISILITSALIGFCTLYVASTSSCLNYTYISTGVSSTDITAVGLLGTSAKYCYCNEHITTMYSDSIIYDFCSSISSMILMTNALQIAASVLSSITNVILGIVISVIANNLLRPNTIPKEYVFVFWGILFSNFINSCIIPLILNANIFGVQFVQYLKFINFMDFKNISIFGDFNVDWYALVSPYYLNMIIIASFISPFIGLIIFSFKSCFLHWRIKSQCQKQDKDDPIIQKQADKKLTSLTFDFAAEQSNVMLFLSITIMYSGLIPLLVPIFGFGLLFWYICKRTIVLKYSVKIPADETLNESIINLIPFIILIHSFFSVWSHTSPGIFAADSPYFKFSWVIFNSIIDRIFSDIIILGQAALILLVLVFDYTIISFISSLLQCCKDELQMPVQFAAIQNLQFNERLLKANILGSYKLINNPVYGHALKAYNQLIYRHKKGMDDSKIQFGHTQQFD